MKCKVNQCIKESITKEYCSTHYQKMYRTGTLEKIRGTPEGNKRNRDCHLSELSKLDSTPDPKRRGYLAVNLINDMKYKAVQRGKEWSLSNMEAYKLIISKCHYCGLEPNWPTSRVGIDRVENNKGYQLLNCVPCCFTCNSAKGELTREQFLNWIRKIHNHLIKP